MAFKIGFTARLESTADEPEHTEPRQEITVRPSLVQIRFESRGTPLSYYNDRFDLHCGDFVYVEGKMEGQRGRVTQVSYNFKIKLSDYKRVIAVADTSVHGQFFTADGHFVTFDRAALPGEKIITWFRAPLKEEDQIIISSDETAFRLDDLKGMKISEAAAERGHDYYLDNKVRYICLDGEKGYAIVEGHEGYEVEFTCRDGEISCLTCSCFCSGCCKHEFAAMLQLKHTLEKIQKNYADEYTRSGYFAAVAMSTLLTFAVLGKEKCGVMLSENP